MFESAPKINIGHAAALLVRPCSALVAEAGYGAGARSGYAKAMQAGPDPLAPAPFQ